MKPLWVASAMFVLCLSFFGCEQPPPSDAQAMEKVRLQLKWVHQAQFAGFYVAREKGYYSRENIEVAFLEGGEGIDPAERLVSGEADFAVLAAEDLLTKRSRGKPLKAVAAIYRRSAVVFAAQAESGIVRPSDFIGKTVAVGGSGEGFYDFQLLFHAMMKKLKIDTERIVVVEYDPYYTDFFEGDVDVTPAYYTGGVIKIRQKGLDPNLIWPSDYGIRFYSDVLAATEKMIREKPDLVSRFVRASLRGWQDAVENYQQAAKVSLKYARAKDPALQEAMMEAMLPLVHTGRGRIGDMEPEIWREMFDILREDDLLADPFDIDEAYTLRFLEDASEGEKR